jgi:DNA-directed RNA polymerase specialized sigma24 family protein
MLPLVPPELSNNPSSCDQAPDEIGETEFPRAGQGPFTMTHWSVVAQAAGDSQQARAALETLCVKYWYPIYAYIRRRGSNHHQAEDLTQAFFAHLLGKELIGKADRNKGKFRTFLLATLSHFLTNDWDKQVAMKRGGGRQIVSLDETETDGRYREEPSTDLTPEKIFERHWALSLLAQALARLKQEHIEAGNAGLFAKLEPGLTGAPAADWFSQCARDLTMSENALRVALHRMRRRFGQLVREEIAHTAANEADANDEMRHLFAVLSD